MSIMTPVLLRAIKVPDVSALDGQSGGRDPLRRIESLEVDLAALRSELETASADRANR